MQAIAWIIDKLNDISDQFYQLYVDCFYQGFPLEIIGDWFYYLSILFNHLAWRFSDFSLWVSDISTKVANILDLHTINDYFWDYFYAAWAAYEWVKSAFTNILNTVDDWWDSTKVTVFGWISDAKQFLQAQINSVSLSLVTLQVSWNNFLTTTLPNLAFLTEVDSLIKSWFTNYIPFWEGWQDWKDKVAEFFTDPEQWLYDKMDEWFERFW